MSRLTRKDMKRDEVLDWVGRSVQYIREHARGLLMAAVAIVVVVGVAAAVLAHRSRQAERANGLLSEALAIYNAPIDPVNPSPGDSQSPSFSNEESRKLEARARFEAIKADFEGAEIGGVAAAYLGDLAADSGDLERAEVLWREALGDVGDTLLAGRLQMNLINLGMSQDRGEEVVSEVRELLNSEDSPLPPDVLLYELARALEELGRTDEAVSAYERLVDEYEDSIYAADARRKLDEL